MKKKSKKIQPRVGDAYQADIPTLTEKLDRSLVDSNSLDDRSESFFLGATSVPLSWENCEDRSSTTQLSSIKNKDEIHDTLESSTMADQGKEKCLVPLPDCCSESWTDVEKESFVLGLYLFGKNLVLVKKLVWSKEMEDILSYYYGKFYKSPAYLRWSECLKSRSEDRVYGDKLFSGWRHDKLLARLFSLVSEDFHDLLIKGSVNFSERKLKFEDYVFTLKDIVGIDVLIKAVAMGRVMQDLTGNPGKSRKRATESSSKAYSSLKPSEIIEILTGDSELSKSQCEELFSKAVWPRLVAKGWRCERLKDYKTFGLKHSQVFLANHVKKFSCRLVKGKDYFNSVSDVLDVVALQPKILRQNLRFRVSNVDKSQVDEAQPLEITKVRNPPSQATSVETSQAISSVEINDLEETGTSKNNTEIKEVSQAESPPPRKFLYDLNLPYIPSDDELFMARDNDNDSPKKKVLIDLTTPCVPSDSESVIIGTDPSQENGDSVTDTPLFPAEEQKIPDTDAASEVHDLMTYCQRPSERKRAMTKRAREALEDTLLSSKRRK